MSQKDTLFDHVQSVVDFRFDERVAEVFPDMISRSIPAYGALLHLVGVIGANFVPEHGRVYDLGCALGAASLSLKRFVPESALIHALDNSEAMVTRLQNHVAAYAQTNLEPQLADIVTFDYQPADLMLLIFTLQFVPKEQRDALLLKLYTALKPQSALMVAEKVQENETVTQWHEQFKHSQGYSALAVSQKRAALENVMKTDTADEVVARLEGVGFRVQPIFQALSFRAWVAIKD